MFANVGERVNASGPQGLRRREPALGYWRPRLLTWDDSMGEIMERPIVHPEVESYLRTLLPSRPAPIQEMESEAARDEFPIVGPLVGRLLGMLARSINATRVFELGSGFGYSTYWFADAVGANGKVVHTDFRQDNSRRG